MILYLGQLLLGIALLYFGAEWLVRGAAGLAKTFGVRPLVIGLTVVAYGTSAPELAVSALAAYEGKSALALANVVGSNIANIGLILGLTALISPPRVDGTLILRELPVLFGVTLLLPLLLYDGQIARYEALGLLLAALLFTAWTLRTAKKEPSEELSSSTEEVEASAPASRARQAGLTVLGLALLVLGGKLFVDGAVGLALLLGMSERVVGLTIVAVGTSLPELAASLVAAWRGHSSLAVGNVVGSNIFNLLLILGAAALIHPIAGALSALGWDLIMLVGITALGVFAMRGARMLSRFEGALLLLCYLGTMIFLVLRGGEP